MNVARHEMGIESNTAIVARRLPRNSRIISAVRTQSHGSFVDHVLHRKFYERRLVEDDAGLQHVRNIQQMFHGRLECRSRYLIVFDPPPCFRIGM